MIVKIKMGYGSEKDWVMFDNVHKIDFLGTYVNTGENPIDTTEGNSNTKTLVRVYNGELDEDGACRKITDFDYRALSMKPITSKDALSVLLLEFPSRGDELGYGMSVIFRASFCFIMNDEGKTIERI
jgi:hypothetical protein